LVCVGAIVPRGASTVGMLQYNNEDVAQLLFLSMNVSFFRIQTITLDPTATKTENKVPVLEFMSHKKHNKIFTFGE
jgi:hypothetical protein